MSTPVLEMKGIGKHFPGVIELRGVDFSIDEARSWLWPVRMVLGNRR